MNINSHELVFAKQAAQKFCGACEDCEVLGQALELNHRTKTYSDVPSFGFLALYKESIDARCKQHNAELGYNSFVKLTSAKNALRLYGRDS